MDLIPGLPNHIARECLTRIPYKQFCKVFALCKGWKSEIQSAEFHRHRRTSGLARTIIVLTQADTESLFVTLKHCTTPAYCLTIFEPDTSTWTRLPPIPNCKNGLPLFCQCTGVGRYLVVIGGWDPTTWKALNVVFIFDFLSATWKLGRKMPGPPRSFFGCASDSRERVFVAGGHDEEKNALRSVLEYNVKKDEWVTLPDMAKRRDECKALVHGGKLHIIGGYSTEVQGQFGKCAETFDIATQRWDNVDEEYLCETGICPRNYVMADEGKAIYRCAKDRVEVLHHGTWEAIGELPADVRVEPFILTWQKKLFLIGSDVFGGSHVAYLLELKGDNKDYKWTKIETPENFKGNVQAGCSLEI